MLKLTASQDVSEFLASADKVEARSVLGAVETEDLVSMTLVTTADDTIKGYVGNIASGAFFDDATLKALSLGSSVISIGSDAFYYNTKKTRAK